MRNYKKENEWQKEKYTIIKGYLSKTMGSLFKMKLKNENKTISSWISENVTKYLNE